MILGSHTASPGGRVPLLANSSKKRLKRMYEKQSHVPMPMCSPVPPRTLREDNDTPISVRMNVESG